MLPLQYQLSNDNCSISGSSSSLFNAPSVTQYANGYVLAVSYSTNIPAGHALSLSISCNIPGGVDIINNSPYDYTINIDDSGTSYAQLIDTAGDKQYIHETEGANITGFVTSESTTVLQRLRSDNTIYRLRSTDTITIEANASDALGNPLYNTGVDYCSFDNNSGNYAYNGSTKGDCEESITIADGEHNISAIAIDGIGNIGLPSTITINVTTLPRQDTDIYCTLDNCSTSFPAKQHYDSTESLPIGVNFTSDVAGFNENATGCTVKAETNSTITNLGTIPLNTSVDNKTAICNGAISLSSLSDNFYYITVTVTDDDDNNATSGIAPNNQNFGKKPVWICDYMGTPNNWTCLTADEKVSPVVHTVTATPTKGEPGTTFNIVANATDDLGINSVVAHIQKPDENNIINITLSLDNGLYLGSWNSTGNTDGSYIIDVVASNIVNNEGGKENGAIIALAPYSLNTSINSSINFTANEYIIINATSEVGTWLNISTNINVTSSVAMAGYTDNVKLDSTTITELGNYVDIIVDNTTNQNIYSALIKMYYSDINVASANLIESTLRLYKFNAGTNVWDLISPGGVDMDNNYVWGTVSSFSSFGIFGTEVSSPAAPIVTVPVSTGKGGGCVAKWDCSEWSKCSSDGIQTRGCERIGTCFNGEKPEEERECEYTAAEVEVEEKPKDVELPAPKEKLFPIKSLLIGLLIILIIVMVKKGIKGKKAMKFYKILRTKYMKLSKNAGYFKKTALYKKMKKLYKISKRFKKQ
jgi:hypothetical protein